MKWKTLIILLVVYFVTGSITVIEGGYCSGEQCLLVMRNPFYITASPPPTIPIAEGVFIRTLDGGYCSETQCLVIMRNPLYIFDGTPTTSSCSLTFTSYVENNSLMYFPTNNLDYNFSLVDSQNPYCYYTLNGALPNNVTCNNGNNSKLITLPKGESNIRFYVVDTCGNRYTNHIVTVVGKGGGYWINPMTLTFVGFLILMFFLFVDDNTLIKKNNR